MSTLMNDTTRSLGHAAGGRPLTTGVAVVAIVFVLLVLIEREVLRPILSPEQWARLRGLWFVMGPSMAVVAVVIASRLKEILR